MKTKMQVKTEQRTKKILMCRPSYFSVDYQINPWMKIGSVNKDRAMKQWTTLVMQYLSYGIHVEIIEQDPGFPDMVFAADQGLPLGNGNFIISRFQHRERRGETKYFKKWLNLKGYQYNAMPTDLCFEGTGDCLNYNGAPCFVGKGYRNCENVESQLRKMLKKDVLSIQLIDPSFYHLDTCMFILDKETVFVYKQAIANESLAQLKKYFRNVKYLDSKEANNFAANSVVHNNVVFTQEGNIRFIKDLENLKYQVVPIDISEFNKAGGGIHCLSLII